MQYMNGSVHYSTRIGKAIDAWEAKTCVKFNVVPGLATIRQALRDTTHEHKVLVHPETGRCSANQGMNLAHRAQMVSRVVGD